MLALDGAPGTWLDSLLERIEEKLTPDSPAYVARVAAKFRFHGTPAHAAGSPEKGRSALDALLLTIHAAELLREAL